MKIPITSLPDGDDELHRYQKDLLRIVSHPKPYVSEKNMLLRCANYLYEANFYMDNASLFDIIVL